MKIEYRDPASLKPYPGNPKKHPPEQVAAIAASIRASLFDQPVVVDKDDFIIKGHGRTLAALSLKMELIPVVVSDRAAHENALNRVLDNRLTSREYDTAALRPELEHLAGIGLLETALYKLDEIPPIQQAMLKAAPALFSLLTTHKCDKCSYCW